MKRSILFLFAFIALVSTVSAYHDERTGVVGTYQSVHYADGRGFGYYYSEQGSDYSITRSGYHPMGGCIGTGCRYWYGGYHNQRPFGNTCGGYWCDYNWNQNYGPAPVYASTASSYWY